ncbi:MAG: hypothetical protein ABR950_05360 [Candidatus Dormibacteria bacterium]|jgi:hypothetical protein
MAKFSDDSRKLLQDAIAAKGPSSCPFCHQAAGWFLMDGFTNIPSLTFDPRNPGFEYANRAVTWCAVVFCNHCGCAQQLSLLMLGVQDAKWTYQ